MSKRISKEDLSHIAASLQDVLPHLTNARIFVTGGTGFFGKWLLETIVYLNEQYDTNCSAVVLSRNPQNFVARYPQFQQPYIEFATGDIKTFSFPEGDFKYCIHAALEGQQLDNTDELEILNA